MKKLITIFCMALMSCGVSGQIVKDSNGTKWEYIKHFDLQYKMPFDLLLLRPAPNPYDEWAKKYKKGIVLAQIKYDGLIFTREIPFKCNADSLQNHKKTK